MTGKMIELTAADGHKLSAYKVVPAGQPRGGLVVMQEIFGLTDQMKRCTDRYAEAGYISILPAMFDRIERDVVLSYGEFQKGGQMAMSIDEQHLIADIEAARQAVAGVGQVAIVGYCFGGTLAYIAACRLDFACAVSYYGGGISRLTDRMQPKAPVMYHFGADDAFIPAAAIDQIKVADQGGIFHVYSGVGHGFICDDRDGYDREAAGLSETRSLAFLDNHL
jgi:carboxymethylenebutenolidase